MTTNETEMLRHYQQVVQRASEVLTRLRNYAEEKGIPLGNGPVVRLASQLIETNTRKIRAIQEKRGIL